MFDGVYLGEAHNSALILCVDVRNFSDFLRSQEEMFRPFDGLGLTEALIEEKDDTVFNLIKEFTSNFLSCVNQYGYGCSYYKLLGDGALVIWDETDKKSITEAITVFDTYTDFVNEELFKPFDGLGLAGALVVEKVVKYEISAEVSQLKYRDYVGYGINLACRLQALADANELILNEAITESGLISFRPDSSPHILQELHLLKGLKEHDRERVLFYDR
jgi:class 3 adenylate cyclase